MAKQSSWFQKTEAFLYHYIPWKGEVESWYNDKVVELGDPFPPRSSKSVIGGMIQQRSYNGSTVEKWAGKRLECLGKLPEELITLMPQEIYLKYSRVAKIETALATLNTEELQVVELKYFQDFKRTEICQRLDRGRTWFDNRRQSVVEKTAKCLGFLGLEVGETGEMFKTCSKQD